MTLIKNDGKFWLYQKLFPPLSMLWLTNQLATLFSQNCVAPIVDCGMAILGAISMQTSWSNIVSLISNSWQWPLSYVMCTYNMLSKKSSQTPQKLEGLVILENSERLDKGSFKSETACEYKMTVLSISRLFVWLPKLFDYLNKSWSQGGRIIKGVL